MDKRQAPAYIEKLWIKAGHKSERRRAESIANTAVSLRFENLPVGLWLHTFCQCVSAAEVGRYSVGR